MLSRLDGDLGYFRGLVLEMGARVQSQVALANEALASCDVGKARRVIHDYRAIRDLDIEAQAANTRLLVLRKPVARDLRRAPAHICSRLRK
jgi:phosphate transport system protein